MISPQAGSAVLISATSRTFQVGIFSAVPDRALRSAGGPRAEGSTREHCAMNRRRRQASRKLLFEVLEPRQLLSLASDRSLVAAAARHAQTRAELSNVARADLDVNVFATQLVHHPLMAERQGLGALAAMMDQHAGYAARHGWGATFDLVLSQHPAYAARHDLTALMATTTVTTLATPTAAATDPASTTTTSPAVTDPVSTTSSGSSPVAPPITSPSPVSVAAQSFTVAVGGVLDATVQPGIASGTGVAYTITPQPLPANMTFNRETGALAFAAAPGQAGTYPFTITATNGSQAYVEPVNITVTQPQMAATEVSGQVVDESGQPLAGMPVAIGTATATTDAQGDFTLTGIGANPGPLSAGGSVATAEGRLALSAPVAQLLGHVPYAGTDNVISTPLIVPKVDWSAPSSFTRPVATQPLNVTNPALPGFAIELAAGSTGRTRSTGTLQVAELSAAESAQHMPVGESSPMLLYKTVGLDLTEPAQLTLPNISGYAPGAVVSLLKFNPRTGGHDSVAQMVVSADGKTMGPRRGTTATPAAAPASGASPAVQRSDNGGGSLGGGSGLSGGAAGAAPAFDPGGTGASSSTGTGPYTYSACLIEEPGPTSNTPDSSCAGCQTPASSIARMGSDAGLLTGEYFQDHQTVTYQSQGQARGIDLQYSSAQADSAPIAQYQFTTPVAGDSSSITSITAQLTVAGVVQTWRSPPARAPRRSWPTTAQGLHGRQRLLARHGGRDRLRRLQRRRPDRPGRGPVPRPWRSCSTTAPAASPPVIRSPVGRRGQGHRRRQLRRPHRRHPRHRRASGPGDLSGDFSVAVYAGNGDGTFANPVVASAATASRRG